MKTKITKRFSDYPFAHRQHKHRGHCRLIHGHNWSFDITLECHVLDENGFVMDFGDMGCIKDFLRNNFDHTLVINRDDPLLRDLLELEEKDLASVVAVTNCGAEALALFVLTQVNDLLRIHHHGAVFQRGLHCCEVTVFEDSKNSATCSKDA